jgi:hypothetical protein
LQLQVKQTRPRQFSEPGERKGNGMNENNTPNGDGLTPNTPPRFAIQRPKKPKKVVDGRLRSARRLRGLYATFMSASGATHPEICKVAAGLAYQIETLNDQIANGKQINLNDYTRAGNALHRALATLGIENWLNEVPPETNKPDAKETLSRLRDPKTWQEKEKPQ